MNPYQLCITDAAKIRGAELRYRIVLAHVTGSPPRPRSASGTLSQNAHILAFSLSSSVEGTRSVAKARGGGYWFTGGRYAP
jgi:hypothetical protein